MPEFPDFSAQGLQIIHELGRNPGGGRVTYLARTAQGHSVVLKQFQFAKGGNWTGFKAIERETQTLRDLKHPGIPRYLGSFETDDGFCLVQEYKNARPLSEPRSFSPDAIKHIATQLLEILVYLQDRIPQVFHRDIKPENVLVSDNLQVYLIDFGFARIGGENLAMSSVAMGTFGFMAPEQTRNLQLTPASDLYGLGLTLVCVIAQLKSHEIGEYVDWSNQLDQKAIEAKIKGCSFRFIDWLNQMVAPDPKKRFPDAATALEALKPLYVKRTPEVRLSSGSLHFKVINKVPERKTQTITITNSVPETILEGYWQVAPHPDDPPAASDSHPWISFSPQIVQGNQVDCQVTVDTRYIQTENKGSRELILISNAEQEAVSVQLSYVKLFPKVSISQRSLDFKANKLREKLTQDITLTNSVPETVLEGYWEVAPHPNDPPHTPDSHPWISFSPKIVQGNQVVCKVTVDTSKLHVERQGSRELIFHSNAQQDKVIVLLQVKTASQLVPRSKSLYLREALCSVVTLVNGGLLASGLVLAFLAGRAGELAWVVALALAGALALTGALAGPGAWAWAVAWSVAWTGAVAWAVAWTVAVDWAVALAVALALAWAWAGLVLIDTLDTDYGKLPPSDRHSARVRFWIRWFLALFCGGGIGAGIVLGFTANILIPLVSLGSGAGLIYVSILPMLTRRRQLAAQRRKEHYLIEP